MSNLNLNKQYPLSSLKVENININDGLEIITGELKEAKAILYSHIIDTLKYQPNEFIQTYPVPNVQGGLVTFCSSEHFMRSFRKPEDWISMWVAGFTISSIMPKEKHYLFYLMKIADATDSYMDLWNKLPLKARRIKNSRLNPLGDIYEPKNFDDPYDPDNYLPPIKTHPKAKNDNWHTDITFQNPRTGRRAALLIGTSYSSFIWSKPLIYSTKSFSRMKKWPKASKFVKILKEV